MANSAAKKINPPHGQDHQAARERTKKRSRFNVLAEMAFSCPAIRGGSRHLKEYVRGLKD